MSFASLQICNPFSSHFPPKSMLWSIHDMVLQLLLPEESPTTHETATRRKCQWGRLILMRREGKRREEKKMPRYKKSKPACVVSGNHLVLWETQKTHSEKLSHTCTFLSFLSNFKIKSSLTQHNMDILHDTSQFCLPACKKIEELTFSAIFFFQIRTIFNYRF